MAEPVLAEHEGGGPLLDCPPANEEVTAMWENNGGGCPRAMKQEQEMCEEPRSADHPIPPEAAAQTCPVAEGAGDDLQKAGHRLPGYGRKQVGALPGRGGSQGESRGAPPAGEEGQKQVGKKKHRRRPSKKKRRWKPYFKLTWEEKKQLDERETLRAARVRAEMFAKGQPVAPYNTTQFLMEDHDQEEPDLKTGLGPPRRSATKSDDTSEDDFGEDEEGGSDGMGGGGGGDGGEFLQRDFSETYEKYHAESLQNMSKQELIREYLELEKCLCRMEEENNRLRLEGKRPPAPGADSHPRVQELELQLESLRAENSRLLKERELQRQGATCPGQFGD
ncbi:protein HEXIM1 [Rhinatrema bivittatum]|uniref:protein HEXIM1 n=1 Tax=Rhinatrema bivittatum TaxID=194408 RepID=UPI00112EAC6F|nr:protein HEXIM1 [Rhinatrema bivittatum]